MHTKFLSIALSVMLFLGFNSDLAPKTGVAPVAPPPTMTVYIVDVGMGDAIFIDIPPKDCMLIDAGSWDNYGIDNLMQFLDEFFSDPAHAHYENTLDVVLATHQHKDHIQGMLNVIKKYTITTYIDNGVGCTVAKERATELVKDIEALLHQKKTIRHVQLTEELIRDHGKNGVYSDTLLDPFKDIDVVALAATPTPAAAKENDNSIVLKVVCANVSFLFMGDAEEKEEKRMMERLKNAGALATLHADVLKAGHHGSNTASSEEFVQAVGPKISLISVGVASESGKTQTFRLPKESVLKRLQTLTTNDLHEKWQAQVFPDKKPKGGKGEKPKNFQSTKEIYITSADGTVVLRTDGKKLEADSFEYGNQ